MDKARTDRTKIDVYCALMTVTNRLAIIRENDRLKDYLSDSFDVECFLTDIFKRCGIDLRTDIQKQKLCEITAGQVIAMIRAKLTENVEQF